MKFAKLASLLAALILAACQSQPVVTPVAMAPQRVGPARGIDLPTDASDVVGELQGAKLDFVARYYRDPASRWPTLSPSEAQRLSSLGTKIVTVWEWHSSDPAYFTYATGYNDALSAARQANNVGQPPGSAIYFAVDFNARGPALYQVDQYFRGINAGLAAAGGGRPGYKIGVYGSGAVCGAVRGAGLAQYAWLSGSTAWDGTSGYSAWNIRQAPQGERFANLSFSHDANEASNDYGGFQLANYPTPTAALVSAAAAVPATAAALVGGAMAAIEPPPSGPAPPAPSMAPAAPAAPAAATAVAVMTPAAPATAGVAPAHQTTPNTSAAEVAALAAAEPATPAAQAVPAAPAAARPVAEPEKPPSNPRSSEQLASREELPRERTAAHAAKGSGASSRKVTAIASNNRAVAVPLRRAGGSSLAESREAERRTSTARRPQNHGEHNQAAKSGAVAVLDRSARRSGGQRRPERLHHAAGT